MIYRNFGITGERVPALGLGAGKLGDPAVEEKQVEHLIGVLPDYGVTLIDTATGYGLSEERIGKYAKNKRNKFLISTKVGYGVKDVPDWSAEAVTKGIEKSLKRMKTDYIDTVFLHSCSKDVLNEGSVITALDEAKQAGKVRFTGYSGENEALQFAIDSGCFDAIMASVNICDQNILNFMLPKAKLKGMGVIAKRPLANAFWRFSETPVGNYAEEYWKRWQEINYKTNMPLTQLALRFSVFNYGVDSAVLGTVNIENLKECINCLDLGPLRPDEYDELRKAFNVVGKNWKGLV